MARRPRLEFLRKLIRERFEIPETIILSEVVLLPPIFIAIALTLGFWAAILGLVLITAASFTAIYFYHYASVLLRTKFTKMAAEYGVTLDTERVMSLYGNMAYIAIIATPMGLYFAMYVSKLLNLPFYISSIIIGAVALMPAAILLSAHLAISLSVKFRASKIEDELPYFPIIVRILDLALVPFDRILRFLEKSWLGALAFEVHVASRLARFTGVTLPEAVYSRAQKLHAKFAEALRAMLEEYETTGRVTKTSEVLSDIELKALERKVVRIADNIDFISSVVSSTLGLIATTLFVLLIFMPMHVLRVVFILGFIPVIIVSSVAIPWYFTLPRILKGYIPFGRVLLALFASIPVTFAIYHTLGLSIYEVLPLLIAIACSPAALLIAIHIADVKRAEGELPMILRSLSERVSLGEDPVRVLSELSMRARSRYTRRALTLISRAAETGVYMPIRFASPLLSFAYETLEGILIGGYATAEGLDVLADTISKITAFKQTIGVARTTMLTSVLMTVFIVLAAFIVAAAVVDMVGMLGKMGVQSSVIALNYDILNGMKLSLAVLPLAALIAYGAANGSILSALPIFTATEYIVYVFILYQPYITKMFLSSIGGMRP